MTSTYFYRDAKTGEEPCRKWLQKQNRHVKRAAIKHFVMLQELGKKAKYPLVRELRDNIWELRFTAETNQYRILFFWDGDQLILLTNGTLKNQKRVPEKAIDFAVKCRTSYLSSKG